MRVIAAGMYRSGSTWLYNACRILLNEHSDSVYSCYEADFTKNKAKGYEHVLLKAQRYRKSLHESADKIITIHRHIDDVKASMVRRKKFVEDGFVNESRVESFGKFYKHTANWIKYAHCVVDYWMIENAPIVAMEMISESMELNIDWITLTQLQERLENIKPPESGYDPVTLLHANHITKQ